MSNIIYKWGPVNFNPVKINGRVVHVALQSGEVYVWTELSTDPTHCYVDRYIRLFPTGEPYSGTHLGTVVMPSGLVWHVVEPYTESNLTNYGQGSEPWIK